MELNIALNAQLDLQLKTQMDHVLLRQEHLLPVKILIALLVGQALVFPANGDTLQILSVGAGSVQVTVLIAYLPKIHALFQFSRLLQVFHILVKIQIAINAVQVDVLFAMIFFI
jgi:hypothetical protein